MDCINFQTGLHIRVTSNVIILVISFYSCSSLPYGMIFILYTYQFCLLLHSLGTSLTMDQFAWTKAEALYYMGILMSVGAVVACVTFAVIKPLCKR